MPADTALSHRVAAVRAFNRFYTAQIGLLQKGYLESPFSLTEVRVLYELAHGDQPTATELAAALQLDEGYLSRILQRFQELGFLARKHSKADGRQRHLSLTQKGRKVFAPLDARSYAEISSMLGRLAPASQKQLVVAMQTIEKVLKKEGEPAAPVVLRPHQPGDMGWVVHRHGVLYAQEYGWDERFEALVAEIAAKFIQNFDPKRERCWIAEKDGVPVGSVFLVYKSDQVAKLRLLLVEPSARGFGIGVRLVDECIRFARKRGYRKITLWTQSVLYAARHIYEKAGFKLVQQEKHHSFGHSLVSETWELRL